MPIKYSVSPLELDSIDTWKDTLYIAMLSEYILL